MKKWMTASLIGAVLLGTAGCSQEEREAAVKPVVEQVITDLLEPITEKTEPEEPDDMEDTE